MKKIALLFSIIVLASGICFAQTSGFTYQGKLADAGSPATGLYDLTFRLFPIVSGGAQIGADVVLDDVQVTNGVFTVSLDFGASPFTSSAARYLEIGVRPGASTGAYTTLAPRQPITSTPYSVASLNATNATNATQLGGVAASQFVQTTDSRLTDARTPTAGSASYIQNQSASSQSGNFNISGNGTVGSNLVVNGNVMFDNQWRTETTTVLPGPVTGPPNLIGGFLGTGDGGATPGNRATAGVVGATIGGGGFNGTIDFPAGVTLTGDRSNRVTDWFGTVGGGWNNRAGNNDATLDNARYATVGGGFGNTASGLDATVGGGGGNMASDGNATVGGGNANIASGTSATVAGGENNIASGNYSFAAGRDAKANHQGTFVWADSTFADFASTGNNQFLIRASGGVGIGINNPSFKLHIVDSSNTGLRVQTNTSGGTVASFGGFGDFQIDAPGSFGGRFIVLENGFVGIGTNVPDQKLTVNGEANKPSGGSWLVFSDERLKNIKGRFTPGLKALMQLQPIRYEYKPDNALGLRSSGEHIGFGAQAVLKIIPEAVTTNDKGYLLVNNDPILWTMLNAIKEQQQTIEKLQQENSKLIAHNAETETRLANVEATVKRIAKTPAARPGLRRPASRRPRVMSR